MPSSSTTDSRMLNGVSLISLMGRLLILLMILTFWRLGGFRTDEVLQLGFILGPITTILLVAFVRFASKYPYAIAQSRRSAYFAKSIWIIALLGHLIIIGLITLCALDPTIVGFSVLSIALFCCELAFSAYIATILGSLFSRFPLN